MNIIPKNTKAGLSLLVVIVTIGAASLIIAVGMAMRGIGESDIGFSYDQGNEAFYFSDGCIDEALQQLRIASSTYTASTLSFASHSCMISVVGTGNNRIVYVTSTVGDFQSEITAQVQFVNGMPTIISWSE